MSEDRFLDILLTALTLAAVGVLVALLFLVSTSPACAP